MVKKYMNKLAFRKIRYYFSISSRLNRKYPILERPVTLKSNHEECLLAFSIYHYFPFKL